MKAKRGLEIYFVLYLAALLLLISDSPKRELDLASTAIRSFVASTFTLSIDKPTLECRVLFDGSTSSIIHFDSINTITPNGLVDSLRYTIVITDQASGSEERIGTKGSTRIGNIRIAAEQIGQGLRIWYQVHPEQQPRHYLVRVFATARPQLPSSITPQQRKELEPLLSGSENLLQSETSFFITYIVDQRTQQGTVPTQLESLLVQRLIAERNQQQPDGGTFTITPEQTVIETIPFVQWENRLTVYGASLQRDIAQPPVVSGMGNVFVTIEGNSLRLRGITTQPGSAQVRVGLVRRDGTESTTTFTVVTNPLQAPIIPPVMYPGIEYRFVPNLPLMSGINSRAVLRDEAGNIRASSKSEPFSFTPSISDTGQRFSFERYAGTERIGQVLTVVCEMFPVPEIISVRREGDQFVHLVTRSYGLASDARSRVRIELSPPSAGRVQELYGEQTYDEATHVRLQHFRVQLLTTATVRALNGYGQSSPPRDLPLR